MKEKSAYEIVIFSGIAGVYIEINCLRDKIQKSGRMLWQPSICRFDPETEFGFPSAGSGQALTRASRVFGMRRLFGISSQLTV
jgi:hypothetical protein